MAAISEILARELGCAQAYVENIITLHMVAIMGGAVLLAGILLTLTCSYFSVNKFLKMKAGELHEM